MDEDYKKSKWMNNKIERGLPEAVLGGVVVFWASSGFADEFRQFPIVNYHSSITASNSSLSIPLILYGLRNIYILDHSYIGRIEGWSEMIHGKSSEKQQEIN